MASADERLQQIENVILDRLDELVDFAADIFEENFGTKFAEARSSLFYLVVFDSKWVLEEDSELAELALSHLKDHDIEEARRVTSECIALLDSCDFAAQAKKWSTGSDYPEAKRKLLLDIAYCIFSADSVRAFVEQGDLASAISGLVDTSSMYGSSLTMHRVTEKRATDGAKGAAKRSATFTKLESDALDLFKSLSLEKMSAVGAAEKLRGKGVPLSIDKLTRMIREYRRDLGTKTQSMDSI